MFGLAVSAGSAIAVLYFIFRKSSKPEEMATPILNSRLLDADEPLEPLIIFVSHATLVRAILAAQASSIEQKASTEMPKPPAKGKLVSRVTGKDEKKSA